LWVSECDIRSNVFVILLCFEIENFSAERIGVLVIEGGWGDLVVITLHEDHIAFEYANVPQLV